MQTAQTQFRRRKTFPVHKGLTLKSPITTEADDIHKYFSLFFWEYKT